MSLLNRFLGCAALLWPLIAGAQSQPDVARILERLDRLERENQALRADVQALRARLDGETAAAADGESAATPAVPLEDKVEIQGKRVDELAQTKVESSSKFPVRLTGVLLFNSFLDSKQNGGFDYPTLAAPGVGRAGATMRQTILGLEFRGPQTIAGGTIHGSVYMDFFSGTSPLGLTMRFRTGSVELRWKNRSLMAGIEKPIFNPREPSSLAQMGVSPLTGAGNLWLWLPQARFQQDLSFTRNTGMRAQIGVVQTREQPPYDAQNFTGNLEASRPALEGRFEVFHRFDDERRIEFAPGFHTSTTHANGFAIPSNLFSMDLFFNPWKRVELTGAFFSGQNVAHLGTGGIRQGYYIYGKYASPIDSRGGWAQLTLHAAPRVDFHLFSGQHDDANHQLTTGSIGKNLLWGGNMYFRLAPNVLVGLEATQIRTLYLGQGTRINNHYDLALGYLF